MEFTPIKPLCVRGQTQKQNNMKLQYIAALGALFFSASAFAEDGKDCEKEGCKKDQTVFAAHNTAAVEAPEAEKEKKDPPKGPG